jgi:hypothetical protein
VGRRLTVCAGAIALTASTVLVGQVAGATRPDTRPFLDQLHVLAPIASTVPANGDVNPYGVAVVPVTVGKLRAGDTLISNFNAKSNVQGTGSTIVEVSPAGRSTLFARVSSLPRGVRCPGGVGLDTAIGVLPGGWVLVGSAPSTRGGLLPGVSPAGCVLVFDGGGRLVESFSNSKIVDPWDLTLTASGTSAAVFVSNALGGNTKVVHGEPVAGLCTISRLDLVLHPMAPPSLSSSTTIGVDFPWRANLATYVLAPAGLALGTTGTLYVDNTLTSSISAIPDALTRTTAVGQSATTISHGGGLAEPLGMLVAPNGDVITVNGANGNAVETTPSGHQLVVRTIIRGGAGFLFGVALDRARTAILLANDGTNALDLYRS